MNPRSASITFAGRERELDDMLSTLGELDVTGARMVLAEGAAGIGKSRLVEELASRARAAGTLVGVGVCMRAEGGGLPYGPVVGVLRDLARRVGEPAAESALGAARRALGLDATVSELAKTQLFETLLDACIRLGERSRVVLVFEDLHWADSRTLEVVEFLARNLGTSPVLLIGTYRNDELAADSALARFVAEMARHRTVMRLELVGLDRDATGALMHDILGAPPDWTLLEAVYSRSGGNPFFAEELTAARDAHTLPSALRNVIMLRVDRLSSDARRVVTVAAVAGRPVAHELLAAGCALDEQSLERAVAEAVTQHVLTVGDEARYDFRHGLQREAVYDSTLPAERARTHRLLALALETHPEWRAVGPGYASVELAGHWWAAGAWTEAYPAAVAAGDALATVLAIPEAYAQYERALAAQTHLDDAAEQVELLLKAADAAYLTEGALARSVELVDRAVACIDARNDARRAATALKMRARNQWATGDTDGAFATLRRAAELLPADPPTVELAGIVAEEARCFMLAARMDDATARCAAALELARAAGAREEEASALNTLGACVSETGATDEAVTHIRRALAIAEELSLPDQLHRAYANLTHTLMSADRTEEAVRVVLEGDGERRSTTSVRLVAAGTNAAESLIRLGRYDDAEALMDRLEGVGVASCIFGPHGVRAMLDLRRGRLDAAAAHIEQAEELSAGNDTVQVRGSALMLRADLALERGEPEKAYADIERGLAIAAGTDDHFYRVEMCVLGARALADQLDVARARGRKVDVDKLRQLAGALVEESETHIDALSMAPMRLRAMLASTRAETSRLHESDASLWREAAHMWNDVHEPQQIAYCSWRAAEAELATSSGRSVATDDLRNAWQLAGQMDSPALLADIERLAQRARITLAADDTKPASRHRVIADDLGLTAREVEVLDQLACGRTDRQIADALFISKKTVSVHVSNILRKLDASNRIDAGEIGQRAGLGHQREL